LIRSFSQKTAARAFLRSATCEQNALSAVARRQTILPRERMEPARLHGEPQQVHWHWALHFRRVHCLRLSLRFR